MSQPVPHLGPNHKLTYKLSAKLRDCLIALGATVVFGLIWFQPIHPLITVVLAIVPFAAALGLRNAFPLCLAFVIFSFFRIHEAFPFLSPLKLPLLLALGTLGVLFWQIFLTKQLKVWWSKELTFFAIFFCLVTFGVMFATNRGEAMAYFTGIYVKIGLMTVVIAWMAREPKHFAFAIRMFLIAGFLVGLVAIFNKINGIGIVEGTRVTIGRDIGSVLGDPNDLSLVLLFPLSFAFATALEKHHSLERLWALVVAIVIIMAIIATQSRGGLIGLAAVCGVMANRYIKSKVLLVILGLIGVAVLFTFAGISDRASGGAHEAGIDESAMGRIYAWKAAWQMALSNPFTGVGLNNFTLNFYFYTEHWTGMNKAVHSTWFGILAESGFPGLIAFIAMVTVASLSVWRTQNRPESTNMPLAMRTMNLALLAGLAGFCVSGSFLTQGYTWPIYIMVAFVAATTRYAKLHQSEGEQTMPLAPKKTRALPLWHPNRLQGVKP